MSKEIDNYLKEVFVKIKQRMTEEYDYIKNNTWPVYDEIKADYEETLKEINRIQPKLKSIGALVKMDEEDIELVYECLAEYDGGFILSQEGSKTYSAEEEEYGKLSYILEMFSFDDDDEDDE